MSVDISYFSFSPARADNAWENFAEDAVKYRKKASGESVTLDKRQKDFFDNNMTDLFYSSELDENSLIWCLCVADVQLGSINVDSEFPDSPYSFFPVLRAYELASDEAPGFVAPKEKWFEVYENFTEESINENAKKMVDDVGYDEDDAKAFIVDFFKTVKPLVRDMKETSDATFTFYTGGSDEFYPAELNESLIARAKIHAEKFKEVLPKVV